MTYLLVVGFTIVGVTRPLGPRWWRFPSGPVGPDAARTEPLAVHRVDRRLGLGLFHEGNERIALTLESLRVPYDPAVTDLAERRESLLERLRLDLRREIADEYVMVVAGVEFGLIARAGRPVNLHLLLEEGALVHGGQCRGRALMIRELDESVRIVAGLADNLASLHGADLREERAQKVLGHRGVQIAHVQRTWITFLAHVRTRCYGRTTTITATTAAAAAVAAVVVDVVVVVVLAATAAVTAVAAADHRRRHRRRAPSRQTHFHFSLASSRH